LQLQADTQTTVTMLCLAGLHVLGKKIIKKNKIKKRWQNQKRRKRFYTSMPECTQSLGKEHIFILINHHVNDLPRQCGQ